MGFIGPIKSILDDCLGKTDLVGSETVGASPLIEKRTHKS